MLQNHVVNFIVGLAGTVFVISLIAYALYRWIQPDGFKMKEVIQLLSARETWINLWKKLRTVDGRHEIYRKLKDWMSG